MILGPRVVARARPASVCTAAAAATFKLTMASFAKPYQTHEERTAAEPRQNSTHEVLVDHIRPVNPAVRLLRLRPRETQQDIHFRAGQWLDVFVPGLTKAGGFTITSKPGDACTHPRSVELAIQKSPRNPPAAWLWQDVPHILHQQLMVRVGGNFTWPPPRVDPKTINRLVFVAGGVGVNPLMSMLSTLFGDSSSRDDWSHIKADMFYTTKLAPAQSTDEILFLPRLRALELENSDRFNLHVHLTDVSDVLNGTGDGPLNFRRPDLQDVEECLGPDASIRPRTLFYVCGPQAMTDEFVLLLRNLEGVQTSHVMCEKWW